MRSVRQEQFGFGLPSELVAIRTKKLETSVMLLFLSTDCE